MSRFSRRAFAGLTLAACVAGCNAVENVKEALPKRNTEDGAARIDARVDATLEQMYLEYPETVQLSARFWCFDHATYHRGRIWIWGWLWPRCVTN